jgi:hypothetical protein
MTVQAHIYLRNVHGQTSEPPAYLGVKDLEKCPRRGAMIAFAHDRRWIVANVERISDTPKRRNPTPALAVLAIESHDPAEPMAARGLREQSQAA